MIPKALALEELLDRWHLQIPLEIQRGLPVGGIGPFQDGVGMVSDQRSFRWIHGDELLFRRR